MKTLFLSLLSLFCAVATLPAQVPQKPKLHIFSIGISDYKYLPPEQDLKYARNDAYHLRFPLGKTEGPL